jgi:hypothetical protein
MRFQSSLNIHYFARNNKPPGFANEIIGKASSKRMGESLARSFASKIVDQGHRGRIWMVHGRARAQHLTFVATRSAGQS